MAKDKKKKDKKGKADGAAGAKAAKPQKTPKKSAASSLKSLVQNPMVADVVAAALVSMAAALKDSDKARRLASDAGEHLNAMSGSGAKHGNAMWDMALTVGRTTLEALAAEATGQGKSGKSGK